ncbi:hypothetical protein DN730_13260 [Marinomonas piezotolerans]|uniref:Uncharacterized protein n=1 Tax=Marinomonas piezotolerans TaxID=2213058 RepID=A0A370U7E7_9GAMM|nr:hypothetical protein [Marinomonas piezotolerans]RDL43709.1 hypothetical protein DN730_13260 [Marinomonas piezotolerans]
MENEELEALLERRTEAQAKLKDAMKGLSGLNPVSLMTGGFKSLEGVAAQFESVAFLNDEVINELARRALENG